MSLAPACRFILSVIGDGRGTGVGVGDAPPQVNSVTVLDLVRLVEGGGLDTAYSVSTLVTVATAVVIVVEPVNVVDTTVVEPGTVTKSVLHPGQSSLRHIVGSS